MSEQNALDALLGADLKIEDNVFIKRLNTYFTIKAIDGKTLDKITEQCTHYIGKGKKRQKEVDEDKFGSLIIQKACIDPDFSNAKLKEYYGASSTEDCVKKALLAGEIAKLSGEILALSGFDDDDEEIDEIKEK